MVSHGSFIGWQRRHDIFFEGGREEDPETNDHMNEFAAGHITSVAPTTETVDEAWYSVLCADYVPGGKLVRFAIKTM